MGLFDAFTGAPAKKAAAQTRSFLDSTLTQGNATIGQGYTDATGAVQAGTAAGRGALAGAYGTGQNAVTTGAENALGYIGAGTTDALGRLDAAGGNFQQLASLGTKYGAGTGTYLDSLGINGAEGNARAQAAFQPSGAYNFNLDQGLESINRARNARGMANSGNTDQAAQQFGAGLASQEYGGWQNRLAGLVQPELAATSGAASGQAGLATTGAGLVNNAGINSAGIETGRAGMLANLASQYGTGMAGLETGQGNTLAGLATGAAGQKVGLASNLANPYAATYKAEGDASMAGNANLWNFGLNAAKAAATLSDRRLKDDIEQVGSLRDGTPVYSYRYKGDTRTQIGLMAQDVEKYAPEAVTEIAGFKAVDYRKATARARNMAEG